LYLTSDKNINTGRELYDIRRAVDEYLNPETLRNTQTGSLYLNKVFFSPLDE
jgi:hypothetical protein